MFSPHVRMCSIGFILDFAIMGAMMLMPFYAFDRLGGGVAMAGWIGVVQTVIYTVACLASSKLVHKVRNGLIFPRVALFIFAIIHVLLPMTDNVWVFAGLYGVWSLCTAAIWPALHSWVGAEPCTEARRKHMGWFNVAWSAGFGVAPFFMGPLYDLDFRYPYWLMAACVFVSWVLIMLQPNEKDYFTEATEEERDARADHDRNSEIFLYAAWSATAVANALSMVTRTIYPKRIEELVESEEIRLFFESEAPAWLIAGTGTTLGYLAGFLSLVTAATFFVMGGTKAWRKSFKVLFWTQVACAAAFYWMATTHSFAVMVLAHTLSGAAVGIAFFTSVYHSTANPRLKHNRTAMNEGAVGIGALFGCIVYANMAKHFGLASPFHWTPVFVAVMIGLQFWLIQHGRRRTAHM